jgi:nucleoid-associated protein YgaU
VSPQSAAQGERAKYYTVQEGDTLYGIAREVYGAGRHWKAIYEANQDLIDNARDLRLSWKLKIPPLENAGETN